MKHLYNNIGGFGLQSSCFSYVEPRYRLLCVPKFRFFSLKSLWLNICSEVWFLPPFTVSQPLPGMAYAIVSTPSVVLHVSDHYLTHKLKLLNSEAIYRNWLRNEELLNRIYSESQRQQIFAIGNTDCFCILCHGKLYLPTWTLHMPLTLCRAET